MIILTDAPLSTQLTVNDWTRKHNLRFITTDARGLFGFIFVDVGAEFEVNDLNGERCKEVSLTLHFGSFGECLRYTLIQCILINLIICFSR